ncbi:replication initiation protein [Butyrivibrio sp. XPD2002]|uniref:replication initiation protein n=1 Tax=Butyrivibrio sp. XPD2002 TaxID=1280665 RepID=UPI00047B154E|nr:replication initiation protein [Butyrivibrio sp. XPD2002]
MSNKANEPLYSLSFVKSNEMISAKYKSSLLENQVMAIALTRIEVNNEDKESPLEARLYPRELKKLVSDERHIYRDLKALSKSITGHTMFLEDGKGNFKAFSVVPNATYKDGVFIIKFNNELKEHILGLEKNFTTLELSVMTDFTKNSSFRIYELLKKDIYKSKPEVNGGRVDVLYNISEFRFMIGLANGDDPAVSKEMARMGSHIDWDVLYSKLDKKDRKYDEWYELQRNVLKPAQQELEEKSDIRFEYEGLRNGRRTSEIMFRIYRNKPSTSVITKKKVIESQESFRQLEMPYDLEQYKPLYDEYVGHNDLTKEDIDMLLKKADFNANKVRDAIALADKQGYINNYVGWLIKCITDDYTHTEVLEGSSEDAARIKEIMKQYDEGKKSGEIQRAAWERVQSNEDFPDFTNMLEMNGVTLELVLSIYKLDEVLQMYADWKVNRPIKF